jgi:multidrug resistance efflux pump
MKFFKLGIVTLLLASIIVLSLSCSSPGTATTSAATQIATVKLGTLLTSVIGTGNLALEYKSELSFGQTGLVSQATTVKVAEVNIVEGQIVEKDQVMVKADTTDWQTKVTSAQHDLDSSKSSLIQAQANLESAQYNLSAQKDIKAIQDKIDAANTNILHCQLMIDEARRYSDSFNIVFWNNEVAKYRSDISTYNDQMTKLLADPAHSDAATSVADIKAKQRAVDQAQAALILAQNKVEDSQSALNDAINSPQEIKAPFKGLITKVSVKVGDIVSRSTTLIEIAQPDKFVANILVTERDVMSLNLGKSATVSFDALSGLNFPAKITKIAPLATISQGVVNYNVTVELTSTTPNINRPSIPIQNTTQSSDTSRTSSAPPDSFGSAQMGSIPSGNLPLATSFSTGSGAIPTGIQTINLKDGLSTTVTIIIQQKDNVLIIPNRAVTRQSGNSTVQVVKGATTETRIIQTGLSDSSNMEVTGGLSEGEQILLKTNTSSSSQFGPQGGGFMIR